MTFRPGRVISLLIRDSDLTSCLRSRRNAQGTDPKRRDPRRNFRPPRTRAGRSSPSRSRPATAVGRAQAGPSVEVESLARDSISQHIGENVSEWRNFWRHQPFDAKPAPKMERPDEGGHPVAISEPRPRLCDLGA